MTMQKSLPILAGVIALTMSAGVARGGVISDVQSNARPMGLDIVAEVMLSGSDSRAELFNAITLPVLLNYHNTRELVGDADAELTRAGALTFAQAGDVRVYFVAEGAGYRNTLAVNTTGRGLETGNSGLIFPNASMHGRRHMPDNAQRRNHIPLASGDFVELGPIDAGTTLDFMLIANGARRGTNVWSTDPLRNSDGQSHAMMLQPDAQPNTTLIGWEDLRGGGDRDYNDLLIAVEFTPTGQIPEPATVMLLGFAILFSTSRMRHRRAPA